MPQVLHVLRCYSCQAFQVHIVKKVNKWVCKICNEKQSVKKVYGVGNGKDCRLLVQKLNAARGQLGQEEEMSGDDLMEESTHWQSSSPQQVPASQSKWKAFLPLPQPMSQETSEEESLDTPAVKFLEVKKNSRKRSDGIRAPQRKRSSFNEDETNHTCGSSKMSKKSSTTLVDSASYSKCKVFATDEIDDSVLQVEPKKAMLPKKGSSKWDVFCNGYEENQENLVGRCDGAQKEEETSKWSQFLNNISNADEQLEDSQSEGQEKHQNTACANVGNSHGRLFQQDHKELLQKSTVFDPRGTSLEPGNLDEMLDLDM